MFGNHVSYLASNNNTPLGLIIEGVNMICVFFSTDLCQVCFCHTTPHVNFRSAQVAHLYFFKMSARPMLLQ